MSQTTLCSYHRAKLRCSHSIVQERASLPRYNRHSSHSAPQLRSNRSTNCRKCTRIQTSSNGQGPAATPKTQDAQQDQLLRSFERQLKTAYKDGFQAGYAAGVRVKVNVDLTRGDPIAIKKRQQAELQEADVQAAASVAAAKQVEGRVDAEQPASEAGPKVATGTNRQTDSISRSAVKGLVWRIFSTCVTLSIALLILHDQVKVEQMAEIGVADFATKFVLYFLHERLWAALPVW